MLAEMSKFIERIPKTDLHVHLDGSLRLSTLIDLAKKSKIKLPSYEEAGLKELVFKDKYLDLFDYLKGFAYTCDVLRTEENLERVSYELALDNIEENVRYIEVRFAPQLNMSHELNSLERILLAVNRGLEKASKEHNIKSDDKIKKGDDIPFKYGIIVGAMRCFNEHFSPYYKDLIACMPNAPQKEVFRIASLELARAVVKIRNEHGVPIVGFDLCGEEAGYAPVVHADAYKYVHKNFMGKTVHAGEAFGPESIFQAITECHANRIGHGTYLFSSSKIQDPDITNPKEFSDSLAEYIAGRRIAIEVCPTSNMQTIPSLKSIKDHPVKEMIKRRISVSICTDNRLMSNTSVTKELKLVIDNIDITNKQLKDIIIAGFKGSFFSGTYGEHRAFVRLAINRIYKLENELFGAPIA